MQSTLTPMSTVADFSKVELGNIRYLEGHPRSYRFNAKSGELSFDGREAITQKGQSFQLIPLAYRVFYGEILGFSTRRWAEIFFLNQANQLCSILFHGYSVDQLEEVTADLFYEEAKLTETILTVTPVSRTHPDHGAYFVASFAIAVLPEEVRGKSAAIREVTAPIYRLGTAGQETENSVWEGYPSSELLPQQTSTATEVEKPEPEADAEATQKSSKRKAA